jgi:hypothetical protein
MAVPKVPLAVVELLIAGIGDTRVITRVAAGEVPAALLAEIVTLVVPGTVGVPEILPVLVLSVSPVGRVPEL